MPKPDKKKIIAIKTCINQNCVNRIFKFLNHNRYIGKYLVCIVLKFIGFKQKIKVLQNNNGENRF